MYQCDISQLISYLLFHNLQMPTFDGKKRPLAAAEWKPGMSFTGKDVGPCRHHEVMCVGKMPGNEQKIGSFLIEIASKYKYTAIEDWYMTNICRYVPPCGGKTIKAEHVNSCFTLLAHEIAIIQPKYLLLFGADAVKGVCGKGGSIEKMRSHPFLFHGVRGLKTMPFPLDSLEDEQPGSIRVFPSIHPGAVFRETGLKEGFTKDMEKFFCLHKNIQDVPDELDYKYVKTPAELEPILQSIIDGGFKEVAVDCEWGGGNCFTGVLRSIQFAWSPGKACTVILRNVGGVDAQTVEERLLLIKMLREFFIKMEIIGHHLRADAMWLENLGIPVMKRLSFDTMLADHILNENAEHGLEALSVRYTTMGRYDYPVAKWLKDNGYQKKKLADRGYLDVPDELLLPYGNKDVDCTLRCKYVLQAEMDKPENAEIKRCFQNVVMPCNIPIHEIEITGMQADKERMVSMVWQYLAKKQELEQRLKELTGKPLFNPRSSVQKSKLLFEEMHLTPFKTTCKPTRMWEDLWKLTPDKRARLSPATDAETLEAIAHEDDTGVVSCLRDFSIVDQVTKNFLRPPIVIDNVEVYPSYKGGLIGCIGPDGRVHTSLSQTSETGRHKSSNPNAQNFPKRQDKNFERIMGEDVYSIRSCFTVPPDCVLIEADYKSAEIYTLGQLANCARLVKDADGDLHARGAVTDFGCPKWDGYDEYKPPPDDWKSEFKAMRVASKTVRFGIPYGRGAKAIAREITKETKGVIKCTQQMAQGYIDKFFDTYPEVLDYIMMCRAVVVEPGYNSNPYGRRRRFYVSLGDDGAYISACERESTNFPIQSTVADTLNVALYNLHLWREAFPGAAQYKILLAVHDAILLQVPGEHVETVVNRVMPDCMCTGAKVPSWRPDPNRTPTKEFKLDIDIEVGKRWGEHATPEELKASNVSDRMIERFA